MANNIVSVINENNFQLHIVMKIREREISAILRQRGYKLTQQRRAILHVIARSQDHLTPAEIYQEVRQEHPGVGLVTIYRTLDILAELGLICEIHAAGSCRSYLLRRPREHHHHLVCSDCGRVVDFTDCDLTGLEQRLADETGFKTEGHLLEFFGCCPECQEIALRS